MNRLLQFLNVFNFFVRSLGYLKFCLWQRWGLYVEITSVFTMLENIMLTIFNILP
ncbi:hypothetical protein OIU77_012607 [Salix suchowensis]|uniref:Uncharacterized protein n=1 Tax=Salix suchowensis TaxID=1278906 RepID=A0ABQ9A5C1_9ROSI|nr:hypothetical protein OIU77_012607 [Salix suchowensis]KAJ6350216.1 hypothetical protein OIU78_006396 [Salix suchowensis]